MIGDYLVYVLMSINAGAAACYLYEGNKWKALYWSAAFTLNLCIVNLKG